jgi:hypothetical protein
MTRWICNFFYITIYKKHFKIQILKNKAFKFDQLDLFKNHSKYLINF